MNNKTPETDAVWDCIRGSAFWTNHPARLLSEELERERDALREGFDLEGLTAAEKCCGDIKAKLKAERDELFGLCLGHAERLDDQGDEIGAKQLRFHARTIMGQQE